MNASLSLVTLPSATPKAAPLATRLTVRAWKMRVTTKQINGYEKGTN